MFDFIKGWFGPTEREKNIAQLEDELKRSKDELRRMVEPPPLIVSIEMINEKCNEYAIQLNNVCCWNPEYYIGLPTSQQIEAAEICQCEL